MTITDGLYIDAVVVKGTKRKFSCSIEQLNDEENAFNALDLSPYSVRFRVLGSATADGEVLLEKLITQNSDVEVDGIIDNATNGTFIFTVTEDDTKTLGLGKHPISLELLDATSENVMYVLTEGSYQGEFSKLQIVQV